VTGTEPRSPRFGEQGRELTYGTYLKIPELVDLQRLLSDPPAHDELLFIVVHQTYELWFKELLFEFESARAAMFDGDARRAVHYLRRAHAIEQVLIQQVAVIETMSPQDSVQFREIEFISGLKQETYLGRLVLDEAEAARMKQRLVDPTLWDGFCALLGRRGLPMPPDDEAARRTSLLRIARDRRAYDDEFELAEALVTHDELFSLWRHRHVLMVERQIGSKSGTGGSTGASYLRTTLGKRFYPELWDLRSYL
jgi:tryptophan 2,3-dioxygenase